MRLSDPAIVLGAGASRGAKVKGGRAPPMDSDFLAAAGDYFRSKKQKGARSDAVKTWNEFKRQLKKAGLEFKEVRSWRLEQLSTYLEARSNLNTLRLGKGRPADYADALELLKRVVCYVLEAEGGTQPCDLHQRLFEVTKPYGVLSFNYDMIADQSLLQMSRLNWHSKEYRGGVYAQTPGGGRRRVTRRLKIEDEIPLIKLHGSMHWETHSKGGGYGLSGCELPDDTRLTFEYTEVPATPYIVPPVAAKMGIDQGTLKQNWKLAMELLYEADSWILWGYSFPPTDTVSQVLFRTALTRNRKAKPVVVINPDASVAPRVEQVCRKVKVTAYRSVERFLLDNGGFAWDGA